MVRPPLRRRASPHPDCEHSLLCTRCGRSRWSPSRLVCCQVWRRNHFVQFALARCGTRCCTAAARCTALRAHERCGGNRSIGCIECAPYSRTPRTPSVSNDTPCSPIASRALTQARTCRFSKASACSATAFALSSSSPLSHTSCTPPASPAPSARPPRREYCSNLSRPFRPPAPSGWSAVPQSFHLSCAVTLLVDSHVHCALWHTHAIRCALLSTASGSPHRSGHAMHATVFCSDGVAVSTHSVFTSPVRKKEAPNIQHAA